MSNLISHMIQDVQNRYIVRYYHVNEYLYSEAIALPISVLFQVGGPVF